MNGLNVEYVFDTGLWAQRPAWAQSTSKDGSEAVESFQRAMQAFAAVEKPVLRRAGRLPAVYPVQATVMVDGITFIVIAMLLVDGSDRVALSVSPVGRLTLEQFVERLGQMIAPGGGWVPDPSAQPE